VSAEARSMTLRRPAGLGLLDGSTGSAVRRIPVGLLCRELSTQHRTLWDSAVTVPRRERESQRATPHWPHAS